MSHAFYNKLFVVFLFLGPSLGSADTSVDLAVHRRCDPIYKPAGCNVINSQNLDFKDRLAGSTGINMQRSTNDMPDFRSQRVTTRTRGGVRVINSSVAGPVNTDGDTAAAPGDLEQPGGGGEQQDTGGGISGLDGGGTQAASVNTPAVNVQNPGSGVTKVGSMVYADEPELEDMKAPGTNSPGAMAMQLPAQAAVNANRGLDTGDGGSSGSGGGRSPAAVGGGGVNPNQFGQIDNSPTPTRSGEGGITGQLKALAAALGNGAMSVAGSLGLSDGGGGIGSSQGPITRGKRRNPNGQAVQMAGADQLRDLLKDRYGRYISSSKDVEFGSAGTHMFEGMCGHYAAYAAKNRIPTYERLACEEK